jgi:hypothetical protein
MYPAEGLGNGLYSINDLPDTIILQLTNIFGDGFCPLQTLSKSNDQFLYGYGDPYDSSPNATAARVSYFFSEEESRWVFRYDQVLWNNYDPSDPQSQPQRIYLGGFESECLLLPYFPETLIVDDQFANSYNVIGFPWSGPFTVDRVNLCRWETTVSGTLYFGNPDNPAATGTWNAVIELLDYYFEVVLVWTNNDQSDFNYPNQLWRYSKLGAPTEPNSSPSGSYSAGEFGSISVS